LPKAARRGRRRAYKKKSERALIRKENKMAESSLTKVSKLIVDSEHGKIFRRRIGDLLAAGFDVDYRYSVDYKGREQCSAIPYSRMNPNIKLNLMNDMFEYGNYPYNISMSALFDDDDIKNLVDATFGVKKFGSKKKMIVPTYNLKKEKVVDAVKNTMSTSLYNDHISRHTTESRAVDTVIRAHFASQECKDGKIEARALHIVEKLKEVMIKFPDVTPQIIERASNEAICHLVSQE
jgi:hypothetical protein